MFIDVQFLIAKNCRACELLELLRQQGLPLLGVLGFDWFGATMGRTGRPNLIHYAISHSA